MKTENLKSWRKLKSEESLTVCEDSSSSNCAVLECSNVVEDSRSESALGRVVNEGPDVVRLTGTSNTCSGGRVF